VVCFHVAAWDASRAMLNSLEQNMFPSVLCQQADFDVKGRDGRGELKASGQRQKRSSGVKRWSVWARCISR